MKKNIILGAGLSGLAYAAKNPNCVIFEKQKTVGGLCRSRNKAGFIFDYSGHLLHTKDNNLKQYLQTLLHFNVFSRKAAAIIDNNKIPAPIQNYLHFFPKQIKEEILKTLPTEKIPASANMLFADWCKKNFGKKLYLLFFKPYNLKFWQNNFYNINSIWTKGFITDAEKNNSLDNTDTGYNAEFMYPANGAIGNLPKQIAANNNLTVFTEKEIIEINYIDKYVVDKKGDAYFYDTLTNTIPLPIVKNLITKLPTNVYSAFDNLKYISVLNLNIGLNVKPLFEEHWLYFPAENLNFYRTGCYSNFAPKNNPEGCSSYYLEKTITRDENKESCAKKMLADFLDFFKLSQENIVVIDEVYIEHAYVVFDAVRKKSLKIINTFFKENNIQTIGRYGAWNYSSMHNSLSV